MTKKEKYRALSWIAATAFQPVGSRLPLGHKSGSNGAKGHLHSSAPTGETHSATALGYRLGRKSGKDIAHCAIPLGHRRRSNECQRALSAPFIRFAHCGAPVGKMFLAGTRRGYRLKQGFFYLFRSSKSSSRHMSSPSGSSQKRG